MSLESEIKQAIFQRLQGTSGVYDTSIATDFGITVEQLEQVAGEMELERCECCGWWIETSEMDENNYCEDCQ